MEQSINTYKCCWWICCIHTWNHKENKIQWLHMVQQQSVDVVYDKPSMKQNRSMLLNFWTIWMHTDDWLQFFYTTCQQVWRAVWASMNVNDQETRKPHDCDRRWQPRFWPVKGKSGWRKGVLCERDEMITKVAHGKDLYKTTFSKNPCFPFPEKGRFQPPKKTAFPLLLKIQKTTFPHLSPRSPLLHQKKKTCPISTQKTTFLSPPRNHVSRLLPDNDVSHLSEKRRSPSCPQKKNDDSLS